MEIGQSDSRRDADRCYLTVTYFRARSCGSPAKQIEPAREIECTSHSRKAETFFGADRASTRFEFVCEGSSSLLAPAQGWGRVKVFYPAMAISVI
jgi:hypothetical protein